jgi:hypothetical protein
MQGAKKRSVLFICFTALGVYNIAFCYAEVSFIALLTFALFACLTALLHF